MMKNFLTKKYYVDKSKIHGHGVFAKRDIKKGEIVDTIKGKVVSWMVKDKKTSKVGKNWIGCNKNTWIDPWPPFDTINHSCDANVGIKGKCIVTALRNIKKDEEICIDYSTTEIDMLWEMNERCKCGSKKCRKTIKSIQYLPKKQFKKYLPFIPTFSKKIYCQSKNK